MILTITLNPTIDKSTAVEKIIPDSKLRCAAVKNEAGGGGINVSKALQKLNTDNIALFPAGGNIGRLLQQLLQQDHVSIHVIEVDKETRENLIVLETSTNKQYRFNMPGEEADQRVLDDVLAYISNNKFEFIVGSGSILPGLPGDAYAQIAKAAKLSGAKFILDTSGDALETAVKEGVYMLKPNIGELAKLSKITWLENDKVEEAALKLIDAGLVELVAVSMGKDGAILVSKNEAYRVPVPEAERRSTVGAGDSMVAGMVHMLAKHKPLQEVICFGVACGTAATLNEGTQLFKTGDVENLYKWTNEKVTSLH
ncbi:MAG: 1-phosphofructokinase family hexose kinase [Chitinophagaceae bacterium]|jgi:6-phosphofructokinase 2|nr:1-phosphofructokinase family hexose kinase [Chitinophagaceae bacterium]